MIGKFVFVFFLAFWACQGLEATPHHRISIDDVISTLKNILQKLQDAIFDMSDNIHKWLSDLQIKIKDIISNIDVENITIKIQEEVDKILAGTGIDPSKAKACLDAAKSAIEDMAHTVQNDVEICISAADDVSRNIKDNVLDMKDKAESLTADVENRITKCVSGKKFTPTEIIECLEDQVRPVMNEVNDFVTEVKNTVSSTSDMIQKATSDLAECASNVQNNVISQEQKIINGFQQCINSLSRKQLGSSILEIVKQIKDILYEIYLAVKNISLQVQPYLSNLERDVNTAISGVNFDEIVADMNAQLDEYLKQQGIDADTAKECIDDEQNAVSSWIPELKETLSKCANAANDIIAEVKKQATAEENAGLKIFNDLNGKIVDCVEDNMGDLPGAVQCLDDLVQPSRDMTDKTTKEINDFIATAQKTVADGKQAFDSCIQNFETIFDNKKSVIYKNFLKCVSNLTS